MSPKKNNPSNGRRHNIVEALGRRVESDAGWKQLRRMFFGQDLDRLCKQSGSVKRWRKIASGETLLRLVLVYAVVGLSLLSLSEWASRMALAFVSEEALGYRLSRAPAFVELLLASLLKDRLRGSPGQGVMLRIRDATVLTMPGSKGTDWRVHLCYDPVQGCCTAVEFSGPGTGERPDLLPSGALDLVVGDMGLSRASGLHGLKERQSHFLVRVHFQNIRLESSPGVAVLAEQILDRADRGDLRTTVFVPFSDKEPLHARLLVRPLTQEAAGRARQKLRKAAKKKGRTTDKLALRMAGYICLLTTLPPLKVSDEVLFTIYRIRWQVELAFKRYKSLLGLNRLRKSNQPLQRIQILGKLLAIALVEQALAYELQPQRLDEQFSGRPAVSLWRLFHLAYVEIFSALVGPAALPKSRARDDTGVDRLRERRRKRRTVWSMLHGIPPIFTDLQPYETLPKAA